MPAALALADVSKSVSAVSFGDLDLDANHVGGDVSWTPPDNDASIETYETYLATDAAGLGGALTGGRAAADTLRRHWPSRRRRSQGPRPARRGRSGT